MRLPDFIGIGAIRSGSTWLHNLLKMHPHIYVPHKRKELNFFSENYEKGIDWYESFFPPESEFCKYAAIGEISPRYLISPEVASRISTLSTVKKLITIFRNPIDRAYSHYGHTIYLRGYQKSFEDFLEEFPDAITHGCYATLLTPYLDTFPKSSFYTFIFEESVSNIEATKEKVAHIFEVDINNFSAGSGYQRVNASSMPRSKTLNNFASSLRNTLQSQDLDWVINMAKRLGTQYLLRSNSDISIAPMKSETRKKLRDIYTDEIESLEKILDIDLNIWRS